MDNGNNDINKVGADEIPRLTLPARIAFVAAICLLTFAWAVGVLGIFGFLLAILVAALNILLALDARGSKTVLWILLAANLLPFAVSAVYLQSVTAALSALYPLLMAMAIYLTLCMRLGRAVSIIAAALPAVILWFVTFALTIYTELGAVNIETINAVLELVFEPIGEYLSEFAVEVGGEKISYFSEADIKTALYYYKTLLIGSIVAVMIVWAYLVTLAARLIAEVFGLDKLLPGGLRIGMRAKRTEDGPMVEMFCEPVKWRIELDSVSAGVYIAAYVVSVLFASADGTLIPAIAAENLILILSPGFFYCGARDVVLGFRGKASMGRMSALVLIPALLLAFINPSTIAILLCALGVIVTFRENGARRKMANNGKESK
ncbi:MAG: hypothetical protein IJ428_05030 [Clostridia bacterium]|nr:hypothetical protein [Clostridia bacterium]